MLYLGRSTYTFMLTNRRTAIIILIVSIAVFVFYLAGKLMKDVYRYPVVGAIYEMLWLPMLIALLFIPIMSVLIFIKNNNRLRLYSILSALFVASAIVIMVS